MVTNSIALSPLQEIAVSALIHPHGAAEYATDSLVVGLLAWLMRIAIRVTAKLWSEWRGHTGRVAFPSGELSKKTSDNEGR